MVWHVVKIILPIVLVQKCQDKGQPICPVEVTTDSPCVDNALRLINWLMFADIILASSVMVWAIWVAFSLQFRMKSTFLHEFKEHRLSFLLNEIGVIVSIPLIVFNFSFTICFSTYSSTHIYLSYVYFVSRTLPPLLYLVTKRNEDCLRCFNKDQALRFSIYQFTQEELKYFKYEEPGVFYALKLLGTANRTIAKNALRKEQQEIAKMRATQAFDETVEDIIVAESKPFSDVFSMSSEEHLHTMSDNDLFVSQVDEAVV